MECYRTEKTSEFTIISNSLIRDKQLSFGAKCVLNLILSFPDNWNITVKGLTAYCKEGRDAVTSAIHELEAAGYIERHTVRDKNGRFRTVGYAVYEDGKKPWLTPPNPDQPNPDYPESVSPNPDFPT